MFGGVAGVPGGTGVTAGGWPAGGAAVAGGVGPGGGAAVGAGEPIAGTLGLTRSRGIVSDPV